MLLSSNYRKKKEAEFTLNTCREGVRNTLCAHITGAVCLYFQLLPSFLHSMGWEGVFVGFDFTQQTLALPCLNSSQEVFFTSSTPTFAFQHPKRTV